MPVFLYRPRLDSISETFAGAHCLVTLSKSASHGLLASVGSGLPKVSLVPSGAVTLLTSLRTFPLARLSY